MSKSAEKAYFHIRDMILEGVFSPGDHLSEEQLSSAIGLSRTPIRDALRRLEGDYFVTIQTNRGARVRSWSAADIEDLFQLRSMLEGFAARRAAERASPAQINALTKQTTIIDKALAKKTSYDTETFLDANRRFHRVICEASGSAPLISMIEALVAQAVVVRTAQHYSYDELKRSNFHHKEMVRAIAARNGELAASIMRTHILAAQETFKSAQPPRPSGQ